MGNLNLPLYRCYKEVRAAKVKAVVWDVNIAGYVMYFENPKFAPLHVSREYVVKHQPQGGGYYVVYADGYESYSPAKAFEEGYTLTEESHG